MADFCPLGVQCGSCPPLPSRRGGNLRPRPGLNGGVALSWVSSLDIHSPPAVRGLAVTWSGPSTYSPVWILLPQVMVDPRGPGTYDPHTTRLESTHAAWASSSPSSTCTSGGTPHSRASSIDQASPALLSNPLHCRRTCLGNRQSSIQPRRSPRVQKRCLRVLGGRRIAVVSVFSRLHQQIVLRHRISSRQCQMLCRVQFFSSQLHQTIQCLSSEMMPQMLS